MALPKGDATFPGMQRIIGAQYTLSHGIQPGVAVVELIPQSTNFALNGVLLFAYGPTRLTFPGCRADRSSLRISESGQIWSVKILDRRWKWIAGGEISGHYNLHNAAGELQTATRKTPQQLATLCLRAMGESGFSVAKMPNGTNPEVHWSSTNPAVALEELCSRFNCRVVLQTNNRVSIERMGQGALLPGRTTAMNAAVEFDAAEIPDSLKLVGGATRFQARWKLEAVGRDRDGKIKPIDQLSYRPNDGWSNQVPGLFSGIDDEDDRALARESVFRWYRITTMTDGSLKIRGYGTLNSIAQVLPIEETLVETYFDTQFGETRAKPARVTGEFFDDDIAETNTPMGTRYTAGFSIVKPLGIVKFRKPVFKLGTDAAAYEPADLQLEVAFAIKELPTREPLRYSFERVLQRRQGTGPRIIRRPEIVRTVRTVYSANGLPRGFVVNDQVDRLDQQAARYLDAALEELRLGTSSDVQYAELVDISPDGAIQQVTWTIRGTTTTRASRNAEHRVNIPPFARRREAHRLKQLIAAQQEQARQEYVESYSDRVIPLAGESV